MYRKENRGFAALLPLLVVAAIVVVALSVKNVKSNQSANGQAVLSESSDRGGDSGSDNNGSSNTTQSGSGTSGEGSGKRTETQVNVLSPNNAPSTTKPSIQNVDLPDDTELPEVGDFPEITDTPEVEAQVETKTDTGTHSATIKIQNGDNHFEVQHPAGNIQVQGDLPLSVNTQTKELTASTPDGVKTVATLPDQAIQNLIASGILSTSTGVQLTSDQNGELHYQIHGKKNGKFLGLVNVSLDKTAQVNVQTGQVVSVNQTGLTKLVDSLTF